MRTAERCTKHKTSVSYLWYKADMNAAYILLLYSKLQLSESFHKRHALKVSNCATKLLLINGWVSCKYKNQTVTFSCNNSIKITKNYKENDNLSFFV